MQVIIKVRLFKSRYTICHITEYNLLLEDIECYKPLGINCGDCAEVIVDEKRDKNKKLKLVTNALFLQPFVKECFNSDVYRGNVLVHLHKLCGYPENGTVFFNFILEPPDKDIIDHAW
jgi:hypothetical protein